MPGLGTWICVGIALAALAVGMMRLARPKFDIIETHESAVSGVAVLLCLVGHAVLMAVLGVCLSLKSYLDRGTISLLVSFPLALVLLVPLLTAVWTYLRLPMFLRKSLKADGEPNSGLAAVVREVADSLGLHGAVDVRLSVDRSRCHGPTVFGRWGSRPMLVLPFDLEQTAANAASGKPAAVTALTRFVLLHELSHVRNGDYQIHSLVTVFLRTMRWWPLIVLLVLAAYSAFAGRTDGLIVFGVVMWPSAIFGSLLFLTWRVLQRHREKLADARAASCLPPSEVQLLVAAGETGLTPLEFLAAYLELRQGLVATANRTGRRRGFLERLLFSVNSLFRRRFIRALLQSSPRFMRHLVDTHPSSRDRLALLASGQLLAESRSHVSYAAAASIFASVSLAYLAVTIAILAPSALLNLPSSIAPMATMLVVAWFTTATVLCLPYRNAASATFPSRVVVRALLGRCLAGGAATAATLLVLGLPVVLVTSGSISSFVALAAEGCALFSAGAFFISILLASLMRFGVLRGAVLPKSRATSAQAIVALALVPMGVVALREYLRDDSVARLLSEDPAWMGSTVIVALVAAAWVGTAFLRRYFRSGLDSVYIPQELWKEALAGGTVMAVVFAAVGRGGASLGWEVNRSLLLTFPRAVPWLDALALVLATAALCLYIHRVQRLNDEILSFGTELVRFVHSSGQELPPTTVEWLARHITACHAPSGGYAWRPGDEPDLGSTLSALWVSKAAGITPSGSVRDALWLLRRRVAGGGFARKEGGPPSLGATRVALDALAHLGHNLARDEREATAGWVAMCQGHDGGFCDHVETGQNRLESTFDALTTLERVSGLHRIDRAAVLRFVSIAWARSSKTVNDAYWATHAHCVLGGLSDIMSASLRTWCLTIAPWLFRLNPRRHAEPLWKALWIMSQLPLAADDAVERAIAVLRTRAERVASREPPATGRC